MLIGIDASRAFKKERTGIEEYSYQVIKHLTKYLGNSRVVLYVNPTLDLAEIDFGIPENWKVKKLKTPIFWTQFRLSWEMFFHPVNVLFIPAHNVPVIHPRNTTVTIHGLEYEFCPRAYSFFDRWYMRFSIKNSCKWARRIIAVSKNTKLDLVKLYKAPKEKIKVVYEGIGDKISKSEFLISNQIPNPKSQISKLNTKYKIQDTKYILFIGRLEERKNICGIIEAFEILKEKYNLSHKLYLVGKFGYGWKKISNKISNSKYKDDIISTGYIGENEKRELLREADVFLFPTFYEGFGLPILEAQSAGAPVVTSNVSSMPEVVRLRQGFGGQAADSAVLVNPKDSGEIARAVNKLISDKRLRNDIIEKGYENVERFSWEKCAEEIAKMLIVANNKD